MRKASSAHPRHNSLCNSSISLPTINTVSPAQLTASLVMLETSGRGWLYARQVKGEMVVLVQAPV